MPPAAYAAHVDATTRTTLWQQQRGIPERHPGTSWKMEQIPGWKASRKMQRNHFSAATIVQEQAKLKISHCAEEFVEKIESRAEKANEQNYGLLKDLKSFASTGKTAGEPGFEPGEEKAVS